MKVIHKKLEMCNVEKNIFLRFAQKASEAGRGVNCNRAQNAVLFMEHLLNI